MNALEMIRIAAVGDLLMKSEIIGSVKEGDGYRFEPIFEQVAPYFQEHDLTIGNLETTFSGTNWHDEGILKRPDSNRWIEKRHPKTRYPIFSCPDELAPALQHSGFDLLTTANNHCMDGGIKGLVRTLDVLDRHGLQHTGTFRTRGEANNRLILTVKGIKLGIAAYTQGTNSIPVPNLWQVNRLNRKKLFADVRELRKSADIVIVCLHFGREYRTSPTPSQRRLMSLLFRQGVNIVLGAHPHVLHPVTSARTKDIYGQTRLRVAASSLGNFLTTRLKKEPKTLQGMILSLTITRDKRGTADITKIDRIKTSVQRYEEQGRTVFKVVPERPWR
ncbi:capsule biosynthesis protein CapA [Paenibacillus alvei]|nr:capsule biosynthesis protein CapA [Paenibacillus alvei]MBG9744021.1 capsule biosynthesis protein CapA [Paenibacillus alvei]